MRSIGEIMMYKIKTTNYYLLTTNYYLLATKS